MAQTPKEPEEMMDIVDKEDKVIGKALRQEIYQKKLMHRIVHVLLFNKKGEMALQLRSKNCSFCPGHWSTTVGGHVKAGETYEEAAMREYEEELGVKTDIEFFSKDFYSDARPLSKFVVTFRAEYEGPFGAGDGSVDEVRFFSMEELGKMVKNGEKFHPELIFLLEKYFGMRRINWSYE